MTTDLASFLSEMDGPAAAPPPPPPSMPAPAPAFNLAALGPTKPRSGSKKDYPAVPDDDGEVARLASAIRSLQDQADAINTSLDLYKVELRSRTLAGYFAYCSGKSDLPSSMEAHSPTGSVLVTMAAKYRPPAEAEAQARLHTLLGPHAARFLTPSFEIKIDGARIPAASAQKIIDELAALFARHHLTDALSATPVTLVANAFHAERHTLFTPAHNHEIDKLMPMTIQVKTKGRK